MNNKSIQISLFIYGLFGISDHSFSSDNEFSFTSGESVSSSAGSSPRYGSQELISGLPRYSSSGSTASESDDDEVRTRKDESPTFFRSFQSSDEEASTRPLTLVKQGRIITEHDTKGRAVLMRAQEGWQYSSEGSPSPRKATEKSHEQSIFETLYEDELRQLADFMLEEESQSPELVRRRLTRSE